MGGPDQRGGATRRGYRDPGHSAGRLGAAEMEKTTGETEVAGTTPLMPVQCVTQCSQGWGRYDHSSTFFAESNQLVVFGGCMPTGEATSAVPSYIGPRGVLS